MIKKTAHGYKVVSEKKDKSGHRKNLSKPDLSKEQAENRLRQIEYFKHKKG